MAPAEDSSSSSDDTPRKRPKSPSPGVYTRNPGWESRIEDLNKNGTSGRAVEGLYGAPEEKQDASGDRRSCDHPDQNPIIIRPTYTVSLLTEPQQLSENQLLKGFVCRKKGRLLGGSSTYDFFLDCTDPSSRPGDSYRVHCFTTTAKGRRTQIKRVDGSADDRRTYETERAPKDCSGDVLSINGQDHMVVKWKTGLKSNSQADIEMNVPPSGTPGSVCLINRKATLIPGPRPTWTLSFGSGPDKLAKEPSCKNLQLQPKGAADELSSVCFAMGKMGDHDFEVHFRSPFSGIEAFAMALVVFGESAKWS